MSNEICGVCRKNFKRNDKVNSNMAEALGRDSRSICYSCALTDITQGRAPEEGDFNSAHIISGEISEKELKWLEQDLRAVEAGRSIVEPPDDEEYIDWCDVDGSDCYCDYDQEEDSSDGEVCKECGLILERD